jgi:hypothetical protein
MRRVRWHAEYKDILLLAEMLKFKRLMAQMTPNH